MTENGEREVPAVEKQTEEAPAPVQAKKSEKPVKEKKPKVPREKKIKQPKIAHPPYFQMIMESLLALKEKSGSSPYAIAKYMEEKHKAKLPSNFRKILALQLKNSVARGKLIKIKASYKLSEASKKGTAKPPKAKTEKKPKQAKANKVDAPKPKAKAVKKTETVKKAAKKPVKKSAPAKPRQPKSIKSPAAKRARKTAA